MAGVVGSDYLCSRESWDAFQDLLGRTSFHIEQKGDLEMGLFLDVKLREGGPRGAWIDASPQKTSENGDSIKVSIDWLVKNSGNEPYASREIATEVEALLFRVGAKCNRCPISKNQNI